MHEALCANLNDTEMKCDETDLQPHPALETQRRSRPAQAVRSAWAIYLRP